MPWHLIIPAALAGLCFGFLLGWWARRLVARGCWRRRVRARYSPRVSERPAHPPGFFDATAMDFDDDWPPVRHRPGKVIELARHQ